MIEPKPYTYTVINDRDEKIFPENLNPQHI